MSSSWQVSPEADRQPDGVAHDFRLAVDGGKFGLRQHRMGLDHFDQAGSTGAIAGGFELDALSGKRQQSIARAHPLIMMHDMIGETDLKLRHKCAAGVLAIGSGPSGVGNTGCDQRILPLGREEREGDADASGYHIAKTWVAPTVSDFEFEVRPLFGLRRPHVCLGELHRGVGGDQSRMGFKLGTQMSGLESELRRIAHNLGRRIAGPTGKRGASSSGIGEQFAPSILQRGDRLSGLQSLSGAGRAGGNGGVRRHGERTKSGKNVIEDGKPALGVSEVDPGHCRAQPDLPRCRSDLRLGDAYFGFGYAPGGTPLGWIGQLLLQPNLQHRHLVLRDTECGRTRDWKILHSH